jgi:secreted trypsin-like serine protease
MLIRMKAFCEEGFSMKNVLFILMSSLFLFSCVKKTSYTNTNANLNSKKASKIINGIEVTAQDDFAKHIVGIFKKGETMCTGVLVSENTLITAAHCESELRHGKISFGLNIKKYEFRPITTYKVHADYDEGAIGIVDHPVNDIAVVQFSGGLPTGFAPAEMSDQDLVQKQIPVIIAGYGRDEDDNYDYLKSTTVNVVEAANYEFRTDEKKNGSCDGDSGGPVFFKNTENKFILVGSVSRGDSQCHQFGVYENVTFYKNWITETISSFSSAPKK